MIPPLFLTVPDYWIGVLIEERLTFASYTGICQLVFLTVIIVFHLKKVAFEGLKMFNRSCRKETWEYDALCTLRGTQCNLSTWQESFRQATEPSLPTPQCGMPAISQNTTCEMQCHMASNSWKLETPSCLLSFSRPWPFQWIRQLSFLWFTGPGFFLRRNT